MIIKPFRGIRPPKALAKQVSSRPYDVLNSEEARAEAAGNEMSLYHIIKPEINFPVGTDEHDEKVYAAAREQFDLFRKNGWLVQDSEEQYYVYNLRRDNWQDRLHWAEMCIVQHKPDLVIFDGIRDVVGDINNYTEAQTVLDKLLSLASWSGACIVCVLHQNKALEDKTLRGALGTELQNKSYETYECQKDPETRIFTLKQTATRKYDIGATLEFTVNQEGLPILEQRARNQEAREHENNWYANQVHAQEIVPKVFGTLTSMRAYDFKQKVMRCFAEVNCESAYRELLRQAYELELIDKRKMNDKETYYDLRSMSQKGQKEVLPSLF